MSLFILTALLHFNYVNFGPLKAPNICHNMRAKNE